MKTNISRLKSHSVRRIASILIVLSLLLAGILATSCETSDPSHPFDTSASTSDLTTSPIPPEPSDNTKTEPQPTTTTTDIPWSQKIRDLKKKLLTPIVAGKSIPFSARILRTPPTASTFGISTDPVIFSNGKQLLDYLDEARYGWQFSDDDIDQLLAAYDDDFFLKKVLIVGAIGLSSGSIKVGIEDIIQSDEQLNVLYRFQFPETGTCDMMSWHYFVEISADDASGRTVAKSYLPNIGKPTIVR
jgi:hypothetical protein